jgi:DNA mismatch endonuclease (patch repair protein)
MQAHKKSASMPRFKGLTPRSAATSRVGAANRKMNTAPEILLKKAVLASGLRFVLHAKDLPGCPDLVIRRHRTAVFCDGDFWHGRHWARRRAKLLAGWNSTYWVAKIERNRQRDRRVTRALKRLGWQVIRIWEGDVKRDPGLVAAKILKRATGRQVSEKFATRNRDWASS